MLWNILSGEIYWMTHKIIQNISITPCELYWMMKYIEWLIHAAISFSSGIFKNLISKYFGNIDIFSKRSFEVWVLLTTFTCYFDKSFSIFSNYFLGFHSIYFNLYSIYFKEIWNILNGWKFIQYISITPCEIYWMVKYIEW